MTSSAALGLATALVRAWTRAYTWRLEPAVRDRRRAEIESELWEFQQDPERGNHPAAHMLARLLIGIPDDLSWRAEHASARRTRVRTRHSRRRLDRGHGHHRRGALDPPADDSGDAAAAARQAARRDQSAAASTAASTTTVRAGGLSAIQTLRALIFTFTRVMSAHRLLQLRIRTEGVDEHPPEPDRVPNAIGAGGSIFLHAAIALVAIWPFASLLPASNATGAADAASRAKTGTRDHHGLAGSTREEGRREQQDSRRSRSRSRRQHAARCRVRLQDRKNRGSRVDALSVPHADTAARIAQDLATARQEPHLSVRIGASAPHAAATDRSRIAGPSSTPRGPAVIAGSRFSRSRRWPTRTTRATVNFRCCFVNTSSRTACSPTSTAPRATDACGCSSDSPPITPTSSALSPHTRANTPARKRRWSCCSCWRSRRKQAWTRWSRCSTSTVSAIWAGQ